MTFTILLFFRRKYFPKSKYLQIQININSNINISLMRGRGKNVSTLSDRLHHKISPDVERRIFNSFSITIPRKSLLLPFCRARSFRLTESLLSFLLPQHTVAVLTLVGGVWVAAREVVSLFICLAVLRSVHDACRFQAFIPCPCYQWIIAGSRERVQHSVTSANVFVVIRMLEC